MYIEHRQELKQGECKKKLGNCVSNLFITATT